MGKPPSSRIHRGNPQFARPTLKGSLGSVSMSPDENSGTEPLNYRVLNATGDDDFIDQMYALANRITPGLLVIGTGPVSPALARDAQDALRDLGATLLWLAPAGEGDIRLGLPDAIDDSRIAIVASTDQVVSLWQVRRNLVQQSLPAGVQAHVPPLLGKADRRGLANAR